MVYISLTKTIRLHGMTIGARVKNLRKWRKLTQEELGERSGLGLGQISKIEREDIKDPKSSTVEKLANGLNVSADKLIPSDYDKGLTGILRNKMDELSELEANDIEFVIKLIGSLGTAQRLRDAMIFKNSAEMSPEEEYEKQMLSEALESRRLHEHYAELSEAAK